MKADIVKWLDIQWKLIKGKQRSYSEELEHLRIILHYTS